MIFTNRCGKCDRVWENCACNINPISAHDMLTERIPIEEWGDKTGLKQQLETHLEYGDDIVRLALITFREYLRDNFS